MSFFKKIFGNASSEKDKRKRILKTISIDFNEDKTTTIDIPNINNQEVKVGKWMYRLGQIVRKETPICELETDNLSLEFESYVTGKLVWMQPKGITLKPGDTLCKIERIDS